MPIHFINGKCHIKQLKSGKNHKTCLNNHTPSISHHIMPLVINALGVDTHERHILTHKQMQFQKPDCGLHAWFNIKNLKATSITYFISICSLGTTFGPKSQINILHKCHYPDPFKACSN